MLDFCSRLHKSQRSSVSGNCARQSRTCRWPTFSHEPEASGPFKRLNQRNCSIAAVVRAGPFEDVPPKREPVEYANRAWKHDSPASHLKDGALSHRYAAAPGAEQKQIERVQVFFIIPAPESQDDRL